jgi:hypothetical protein
MKDTSAYHITEEEVEKLAGKVIGELNTMIVGSTNNKF